MPVVMNKSVYFGKKSYLQVSTKVNVSLNWLLKPSKRIIKRKDEMENLKSLKKIIQISKSRHMNISSCLHQKDVGLRLKLISLLPRTGRWPKEAGQISKKCFASYYSFNIICFEGQDYFTINRSLNHYQDIHLHL